MHFGPTIAQFIKNIRGLQGHSFGRGSRWAPRSGEKLKE